MVVSIGNTTLGQILSDASETLGRAHYKDLSTVGREFGFVNEAVVFDQCIGPHCVQIEPINGSQRCRALRIVFPRSHKQDITAVIRNVLKPYIMISEGERLHQSRV